MSPAEAAVPTDCRYAEGVAILIDEGGVVTGPVGTTVAGELSVDVTVGATVTVSVVAGTGPEGQVAVADSLTIANVTDGTAAVFVFVPSSGGGTGDGDTGSGGGDPDGEPGTGTGGNGPDVGNEEPATPPDETGEPGDDSGTDPVVTAPDGEDESVVESAAASRPTSPSGLVTVAALPSTGAGPDSGVRSRPVVVMLAWLAIMLLSTEAAMRCRMNLRR